MKESALPSPGKDSKAYHLRRVAAAVISTAEVLAPKYTSGRTPFANTLQDFFQACADALTDLRYDPPTLGFTPTAKTYSIGTGVTAGPTLSKGGSSGAASYVSSDPTKATVNATTGAVTPLVVGTTTITVTVAANGIYAAATKSYVATITA